MYITLQSSYLCSDVEIVDLWKTIFNKSINDNIYFLKLNVSKNTIMIKSTTWWWLMTKYGCMHYVGSFFYFFYQAKICDNVIEKHIRLTYK